MRVPDYRLFELEQRAERVLADGAAFVGDFRVNVEDIIVVTYGLMLKSFARLKEKWDTYAFHNVAGNTIFVDAGLMDNEGLDKKYRFTLAEELAHTRIHAVVFEGCNTPEDRLRTERKLGDELVSRLDRQAKALGSAILMPRATVVPLVEGMAQEFHESPGVDLADVLANEMKSRYDVNFRAARHRLKLLGYHKEEKLGLNL